MTPAHENPSCQQWLVTIKGDHTEAIEDALAEIIRLVGEGYTSGFDSNETGCYRFSIQNPH